MSSASKIVDALIEGEAEEFITGTMKSDPLSKGLRAYEDFRKRHPGDFDEGMLWRVVIRAIGWRGGANMLGVMADNMMEAGADYLEERMSEEELISALNYTNKNNIWTDATPQQLNAIATMFRAYYVAQTLQ